LHRSPPEYRDIIAPYVRTLSSEVVPEKACFPWNVWALKTYIAVGVSSVLNKTVATIISFFLCVSFAAASDRSVVVGGVRIHISESGTGPTVVFESGMGEDTSTWNDVRPEIAGFAHTVAYDRPGLGQSEPTPLPRTVVQMAADLHAVLEAAKLTPPYVLVGHSLGGAIVQVFAYRYPDEVAGLVLVDPEDGRLIELLHSRMSATEWTGRQRSLDEAIPNMPPPMRAELRAADDSGEDVARAVPLPLVPVIVLTGTKKNPKFPANPLEQDLKLELHNALVANTPGAQHILVPNSRHYIQNDAPKLVIEAVWEVLTEPVGKGLNKKK
jgi:pimeloyl-ACP methyl ester carboxylesterase